MRLFSISLFTQSYLKNKPPIHPFEQAVEDANKIPQMIQRSSPIHIIPLVLRTDKKGKHLRT